MKKAANFSNDRKYRYSLSRIWDEPKGLVLFVCLNPSTADESIDDKTVTKCIKFAKAWNYGGILIGNLFAIRSKDSNILYKAVNSIGPDNDKWLKKLVVRAKLTIVAWGNKGSHMNRSMQVLQIIHTPYSLIINKTGEPRHPLFISLGTQPIPYENHG